MCKNCLEKWNEWFAICIALIKWMPCLLSNKMKKYFFLEKKTSIFLSNFMWYLSRDCRTFFFFFKERIILPNMIMCILFASKPILFWKHEKNIWFYKQIWRSTSIIHFHSINHLRTNFDLKQTSNTVNYTRFEYHRIF